MEFVRRSGLWKNSYFLSNKSCFFHRFADSGFRNKWTGLWHRETKFLEFLALKAGGEWLSERNCRGLVYDGLKATHTFKSHGNLITQALFLPETGHLVMELSARKPAEFELELAVNIRRRSENRTDRPYSVRKSGNTVTVYNSLGSSGPRGFPA